ncbi:MAG: hypothetical protein IT212_04185, partial [Bacteroidia bacterium]|nr:hypothetical protein [Bacteroidia bacterium]
METQTGELGCPKCGSVKYIADTKGFSTGKAVAGAILTGGIGLLAGTLGSKDVVLTCVGCGHKYKPGEGKPVHSEEYLAQIDAQVKELLKEGKDAAAINLLKEKKDMSNWDATLKCGEIKQNLGIKAKGCAGVLLLLITLGGAMTFAIIGVFC